MSTLEELNDEINQLEQELLLLDKKADKTQPAIIKSVGVVKRGRGRPPVVEDERFIEIWNAATQDGKDLRQVAVDLGIAPASASVRASLLRKRGNTLSQFRRGRRKKIQ